MNVRYKFSCYNADPSLVNMQGSHWFLIISSAFASRPCVEELETVFNAGDALRIAFVSFSTDVVHACGAVSVTPEVCRGPLSSALDQVHGVFKSTVRTIRARDNRIPQLEGLKILKDDFEKSHSTITAFIEQIRSDEALYSALGQTKLDETGKAWNDNVATMQDAYDRCVSKVIDNARPTQDDGGYMVTALVFITAILITLATFRPSTTD